MHTIRFIGGLFSIFLALAISYFFSIDFQAVLAGAGFVLIVDSLIVRYLTKLYMQALIEIEEANTNKEEK